MKVEMEKALFHEDYNQPPLSSPPWQGGERGAVVSSRHNIRYNTKIAGEFQLTPVLTFRLIILNK